MPKIVTAFVRAEVRQALAEERPERLGAATASGANKGLELREAELDGIEVRAVGWQVPEGGSGGLEGPLDTGDLVGPEVVGDNDVAGVQGRHQDLVDVGAEPPQGVQGLFEKRFSLQRRRGHGGAGRPIDYFPWGPCQRQRGRA